MADLFADIVGQHMAVSMLKRALEQGASHAYLFSGPPGAGKSEAAVAFAAGLACADNGCGECSTCRRVLEGVHPDVEIVAPEGNFIRKEDITEINLHAVYRPYEARAKVYIFLEAESFNEPAANAFLKTLEEPPAHVHFLLVTDRPERLKPTIVSRCQPVAFSPVPIPLLTADLVARYGLSEARSRSAGPCLGRRPLSRARAGHLGERAQTAGRSAGPGARPAGHAAVGHRARCGRTDGYRGRQGGGARGRTGGRTHQELWSGRETPAPRLGSRSSHEERVKRQQRRLVTSGLQLTTRTMAAWYRDLALMSAGAEEAVLNQDRLDDLRAVVLPGRTLAYTRAVEAAGQAAGRLRYNVDARCAIGDMFRNIKEALT